MSTWHKKVSQSLADSVATVLKDYADHKDTQNKKLKKGPGEPIDKPTQELPGWVLRQVADSAPGHLIPGTEETLFSDCHSWTY